MSGKATLYFVVTKVTAPSKSSFNLVLSIGNSKVTLASGKNRGTTYNLPYKTKREVTNSPEGSSSYRSCNVQINFLEGETTTNSGSIRIKPEDFLNASPIDVKEYPINVPNVDAVSAQIGVSLIPDGGAEPSNYNDFGESAKLVSDEARQESDSSSHHSRHHSSQPEQPPADGQMEGAEEIVESESGRKHRRKKGTKDTNDGTFISDGGHTHRRRHRSHTSQPATPPPVEPTPPPAPTPDQQTADGQMEGAEEIVESESGRKHRRKKGTKDTNDGTFISDGGHTHRRKHRSHKTAEPTPETKTEEAKPPETKTEEAKPPETKTEEEKPPETKTEEEKPAETKPEEPKPAETKSEETKSVEIKVDEPKAAETKQEGDSSKQILLQIDELPSSQNLESTQEAGNHQQLVEKVNELKDVVEKQTNWIHSLYSKLSEHGLSQSMKPTDFPFLQANISDFPQTLRSRGLAIGEEKPNSPSQVDNDLQKACQTGEYGNPNRRGVNNIEDEQFENHDNYDEGPLRHFHFSMNEIKEPEEPIISTSDGLSLSYSIRNDCFFRPHYNFEMLDISGRFSFEVFQSPFEIEREPLSIDCKYNPTIEYNSGDGGYSDIPMFSPTRSRFQTEVKGRNLYYDNQNQDLDQYPYQTHVKDRVFSPGNSRLSISGVDGNDTSIPRNNGFQCPYRRNQNNYGTSINDDFHSAFHNSSDRVFAPKNPTEFIINNTNKNIDDGSNFNHEFNNPGNDNNFIQNDEISNDNNNGSNDFVPIRERNIELNQFSNSSNSFNSNPNANQNFDVSPNFSPSSTQSFNSQPLLIEQQNQLKQKIQEQMQKQQKQLQKQMDELHQMRKELTEQTQQMQEQLALQMQEQMQIQQQNIQSMHLSLEKKKQMMQVELENERKQMEREKEIKLMELEKERKQMDNSKQLLEIQMEREKDLMEKERAKMEKERQTLRQQRLLQEEELLQLKNQRELQRKEMQQLQKLQDLHKQQQQELQEQQEQHIQQRKELQQQQSLSPSVNQQIDPQQQNSFSAYASQQVDPQQQPFSSSPPSHQTFDPQQQQQQQLYSSPASMNQQFNPQQMQQPLQTQQDPQSQNLQQQENFNFGGNGNLSQPFPQQNGGNSFNSKSRQFDCKIFTDETIYLPPKKKQEQQNQPSSQDGDNDFSGHPPNFNPVHGSDFSTSINVIQEEEEIGDAIASTQTGENNLDDSKKAPTVALPNNPTADSSNATAFPQQVNFRKQALLSQNSDGFINSEALDNINNNCNFNYPQTHIVSLDDADINLVLHRSNTDVSNKNINKILTSDKSTAPPIFNQTKEASPILQQQGRRVNSTNNLDPRELNNNDGNRDFNNDDEESLLTNLDQNQNDNYQFNGKTLDLGITNNIVA